MVGHRLAADQHVVGARRAGRVVDARARSRRCPGDRDRPPAPRVRPAPGRPPGSPHWWSCRRRPSGWPRRRPGCWRCRKRGAGGRVSRETGRLVSGSGRRADLVLVELRPPRSGRPGDRRSIGLQARSGAWIGCVRRARTARRAAHRARSGRRPRHGRLGRPAQCFTWNIGPADPPDRGGRPAASPGPGVTSSTTSAPAAIEPRASAVRRLPFRHRINARQTHPARTSAARRTLLSGRESMPFNQARTERRDHGGRLGVLDAPGPSGPRPLSLSRASRARAASTSSPAARP